MTDEEVVLEAARGSPLPNGEVLEHWRYWHRRRVVTAAEYVEVFKATLPIAMSVGLRYAWRVLDEVAKMAWPERDALLPPEGF